MLFCRHTDRGIGSRVGDWGLFVPPTMNTWKKRWAFDDVAVLLRENQTCQSSVRYRNDRLSDGSAADAATTMAAAAKTIWRGL